MVGKEIHVGYAPVGVKFNADSEHAYPQAETYRGISFCDAVRQASDGPGRALVLEPDSISVCRWSTVVLGFKEPDPRLDLKVEYNVPYPTRSVLVAPMHMYADGNPPDTVLMRTSHREMTRLVETLGPGNVASDLPPGLDKSALSVLDLGGKAREVRRVRRVNRALAELNRYQEWRDFTKWIFARQWTTFLFDLLLDRYLANMSMCRNSTVIPLLTGKLNVSFFCTGGIAWGENKPAHMTCGMPYGLYRQLDVSWP